MIFAPTLPPHDGIDPAEPGDLVVVRASRGSEFGTLAVVTRVSKRGRVTRCRLLRAESDFRLPQWQCVRIVGGVDPDTLPADFPAGWRSAASLFAAIRAAGSPSPSEPEPARPGARETATP